VLKALLECIRLFEYVQVSFAETHFNPVLKGLFLRFVRLF